MDQSICIVGAGVIGLSSALVLARAGRRVRIIAAELPEQTTSSVAAACWYPFSLGNYDHRWASDTHAHFLRLLGNSDAGVRLVTSKEYFAAPLTDEKIRSKFWWHDLDRVDFGRIDPAQIPPGYIDGIHFSVPVIHMPTYLKYLQQELSRFGVSIDIQRLENLEDVAGESSLLVNCTGLGAKKLCNDQTLYPAQGQIAIVENAGPDEMVFGTKDPDRPIYIIPRGPDTVLGGTFVENSTSLIPAHAVTEEIRQRCAAFVPALSDAKLLNEKSGLRPCRQTGPRLEIERRAQLTILHNYGHGGAGVTASWGCALRMAELILSIS